MPLRKQLQNPIVQQYLLEIVFPLIGYFFFDWDILIIGVYYLVDHFCSQALFYRRAHWVNVKNGGAYSPIWILGSAFSFVLLFAVEVFGLVYIIIETQNKTLTNVQDEVWTFTKSELWFLFPVVLVLYHFKDQFTFYMPRRYLNFEFKRLMVADFVENGVVLFLLVIGGTFWIVFSFSPVTAIIAFIVAKIIFDLTLRRLFVQHALKSHSRSKTGH